MGTTFICLLLFACPIVLSVDIGLPALAALQNISKEAHIV